MDDASVFNPDRPCNPEIEIEGIGCKRIWVASWDQRNERCYRPQLLKVGERKDTGVDEGLAFRRRSTRHRLVIGSDELIQTTDAGHIASPAPWDQPRQRVTTRRRAGSAVAIQIGREHRVGACQRGERWHVNREGVSARIRPDLAYSNSSRRFGDHSSSKGVPVAEGRVPEIGGVVEVVIVAVTGYELDSAGAAGRQTMPQRVRSLVAHVPEDP